MYFFSMIFLFVMSSFYGLIYLTKAGVTHWSKQDKFKVSQSIDSPGVIPTKGIYSVSTVEYYSIH